MSDLAATATPVDPALGEFVEAIAAAAADGTLAAITLSQPVAKGTPKQTVRPVTIASERRFQWTDHARQQTHRNLTAEETVAELTRLLPAVFRNAHGFTADADLTLRVTKKGAVTIGRSKPSKGAAAVGTGHDRERTRILPEGEPVPFLVAAGLMLDDGRVPKAKQAKFRQLNRFCELVDDIVADLPAESVQPLRVVEFGSGHSHLAFAVRHLLVERHKRKVAIEAIDRHAAVIESARQRAATLGITDMTLTHASIEEVTLGEVDLAIWLHACDTATDAALRKSVEAHARVILAVPCCQHEINAALPSGSDAGDDPLTAFGLLKERYAALATDALRANWLQRQGYRTQVVEFIDLEHTAKNVLIRAVRRSQPLPAEQVAKLERAAAELEQRLGLTTWSLGPAAGQRRPETDSDRGSA